MTRYFFSARDRYDSPPDEEGVELASLAAVRAQAIEAARSLICDDITRGVIDLNGTIEVTDEAGSAVLHLRFDQAVLQAAS